MLLYIILGLLILVGDQLLKGWIVANVSYGVLHTVIPNILGLTYVQNDGAAWSMLAGQQWFFYIVTIIAVGVIGYLFYTSERSEKLYRIGLTLMLAGALGNFIDRLHLKYVVDMFQLEFINFPIFNVADTALTCGVICVFIAILLKEKVTHD
ncbi:signal peptidase II [Latilactobacillus sakei]|uniref:signal peptidase II n=1 Tax=Latilactobacillus sakei TaxID=1599 RepID=UPI00202E51D1|nr:signal peptidase II [Latilactobacillus sakei]MCM1598741.1 signal peptidase II [Latilactobacillus sakei]